MNVTIPNAAVGSIALPSANQNAGKQNLGQQDFMKLLAAQLSAQDPMEPMKDTEFISQMANFSSLQQMSTLSTSFSQFADQQRAAILPTYLGREVTVFDPELGEVTGTVSGVLMKDGQASIVVNGTSYDPAYITEMHLAAATPAAPTDTQPNTSAQ